MSDRRTTQKKKGDKQIHRAKFVVGCALIGTVVTGAFFGWVPASFDVRIIGAGLGAIAGIAMGQMA